MNQLVPIMWKNVLFTMWFQDSVFNQSYNCQTSHYLGRNWLLKPFLILPSLVLHIIKIMVRRMMRFTQTFSEEKIAVHLQCSIQESDNLQYNTLFCWFAGTNESFTMCLVFQVLFIFHNFLQNYLQKSFQFIFLSFHKFTKMKIKSFECPKSITNYKKTMLRTSDGWSTSHLSWRTSKPAYYIVDCRILCILTLSIGSTDALY